MNWLLDILITHRRLKGLTEQHLRELIECTDITGLRTIKEHLDRGEFKYPHIEKAVPELTDRCIERAKELLWKQNEPKAREAFMASLGDPFVV